MPHFLLLRLEAPLVAFGDIMVDAKGPVSDLPSASMLTGLLGNALGYRREERTRLQRLQDRIVHAARLDRSGRRFTEFQTARLGKDDQGWTTRGRPEGRAGGDGSYEGPHLRYREHDCDVSALVALCLRPHDEAPDLEDLAVALQQPARPLFIGRKPCLPSSQIFAGITEAPDHLAALTSVGLASARTRAPRRILVDLPRCATPPDGFRTVHCSDSRDWIAGVHTGDSLRWHGLVPLERFASETPQ
ncbi:type I-E CRISPR-associated protein Cas5/CasD [Polymorphum gilvum]|uniref:CRISPR-associated protein Cas5 family n=1 Tax=Polymorphum gilvum (strain LMG 25793 / CGMCC 1.9160 / SL003B-26A1) TaxID=991905 RepID=F2J612_POLGS|nr:type I-E CRISPR-associated protein Cas5/CasD [Polymorphum gilvum]ADZ71266.1 CRISPR-associated protein Cas5 family [Polymorphum gilvum SL003B-26A1]